MPLVRALGNWAARVVALAVAVGALAVPAAAYLWSSGTASGVARQHAVPVVDPPAYLVSELASLRYGGSIPILTYHNIEQSPSRYAVSPESFSAQMELLAQAGFHPVSAAQFLAFLEDRPVELPERPILITFDDGPKSVWVNADPVLARHGFHAVMFTITGRVGRHQPYYLTWDEIERMAATGRWDFESHTRFGHTRVETNPTGGTGAFLTNEKWLPGGRRESLAEYERRVRRDLSGSIDDLTAHGLPRPRMFAFPFSASSFPTNDVRIPPQLDRFVTERFEAVMDNVDEPTYATAAMRGAYLPRIEIFNDTTLRRFVDEIRAAAERTERSYSLVGGPESIYSLVDQGDLGVAHDMLRDVWRLPRSKPARLSWPLTWTADPFHEPYWRFVFYSLRPTSNLLWAYYATGEPAYRDKLLAVLRSFVGYDSQRTGVDRNRLDNQHAAAFRAMVLVNTYWKLHRSGDLPPDLAPKLRSAIGRLGGFLADPANYQARSNHGFTEAAALLLVAEAFPDLDRASVWRDVADKRLADLMRATVGSDGVEIENSPFYHFYVLTFATEIAEWADRFGVRLPGDFSVRLARMVRYATAVTLPSGWIPLLGSSVALDVRRLRPDLYESIGKRFPQFEYVRTAGAEGSEPQARLAVFKDAGQAILRSGWGPPAAFDGQTHIVLDAGPYRTSHSQLDTLAVTYYSAGRMLLPDSGLFRYGEGGADHRYFWSTRAHNSVVVDGRDQHPGAGRLGSSLSREGWLYQSASHKLYPGVEHARSVLLLDRNVALVIDSLTGSTKHRFAQTWHLFPGARPTRRGLTMLARSGSGRLLLAIHQGFSARVSLKTVYGARHPLQGWYSDSYGVKVPTHALEYISSGRRAAYATLITSGPRASQHTSVAAIRSAGGDLRLTVVVGNDRWLVRIRHQAKPGEIVSVDRTETG